MFYPLELWTRSNLNSIFKGGTNNGGRSVRGEPIVCTPEDAYKYFMRTEMDTLVLGDFVLMKKMQPEWKESKNWRGEFELD